MNSHHTSFNVPWFSMPKKFVQKSYFLEEYVENHIWIQKVHLRFFGIEIGARMTVIRLPSGVLFIHSPTRLDDFTRLQLRKLGTIAYVVSPCHFHHFFIGDYFDSYPRAKFYAPPGLIEKRKDLPFKDSLQDDPEWGWEEFIDQTIFRGGQHGDEVVFLHKASKTLIVGDLLMNFRKDSPILTRIVTRITGSYNKVTVPFDPRSSMNTLSLTSQSVERILEWDFDRIILAHGRVIDSGGKEAFRKAFSSVIKSET